MRVKAAVARSHGQALRIEGLNIAEPRSDEMLVKMVACGVSQIDLDAIDGRMPMRCPFVPGSEGAGIVERVGDDVANVVPGDAVVMSFDYCGRCAACAAGRPRSCEAFDDYNFAGRRVDGFRSFEELDVNGRFFGQSAFSTHVTCRASRAVKLAKGSPLEALACLGGDVLLAAGVVLRSFRLKEGDSVVVSGGGAIGLAAAMIAQARGATPIIVVEADERCRDLACDLGVSVVVHTDENLADLVRSLSADGADFALETTGAPQARRACLESLAAHGTCALVGPRGEDDDVVIGRERQRIVSAQDYASPSTLVPELAALHASGDLPLEKLVDFFEFERVNDALDALRSGAVAKPVLRFSIGSFGDLDRAKSADARVDAPAEPFPTAEPSLERS